MRLKESLAEIHPDHLLTVIESHLADGRYDAVRQSLPALIEQHCALADELHAIERRIRHEQPPSPSAPIAGSDATVFDCPSCGGTLMLQAPDSVEVICQYCGTETTLAEAPSGGRWQATLDPEARFGIGSFFQHEDTRWQAIGVQRFVGSLREWDNEDDVWEENRVSWSSWWMLNAARELAWLEDHGKHRYWSVPTVPENPVPPPSDSRAHEHGEWELVDAAGEFSYRVREGERHRTVEPCKGASRLSIETRLDDHGEALEIEYFVSHELANRDVVAGIGDLATLASADRWKRTRTAFIACAFVCALAYVALGLALPSRELLRVDVALAPAMPPTPLGSVTLDERFPIYRFSATTQPFSRDAWLAFDLELTSPDDNSGASYVPFEFWRESGSDTDGPWLESEYAVERRVRIDKHGVYALAALDVDSSTEPGPNGTSIRVSSNAFSMLPSIVAALLALGLALIAQVRASSLVSGAASLPPLQKSPP